MKQHRRRKAAELLKKVAGLVRERASGLEKKASRASSPSGHWVDLAKLRALAGRVG